MLVAKAMVVAFVCGPDHPYVDLAMQLLGAPEDALVATAEGGGGETAVGNHAVAAAAAAAGGGDRGAASDHRFQEFARSKAR
jgi:hypothetical protein